MKLWIGTSGFQYPEWIGKFYPDGMARSKMLPFYAAHFSSTEVNYTFRRIPAAKTILGWSSLTPPHFCFAFKAPQRITHFAKLVGCGELLRVFDQAVAVAEEKRGPVLFQLPPTFTKDLAILRGFLGELPDGMRAAFEFRHKSWFDEAVFQALDAANAALCIAEDEKLATPSVATTNFGYLRLRREDYGPANIQQWASFLEKQEPRWSEAFVYFKHEEQAVGPRFAQQLEAALGRST